MPEEQCLPRRQVWAEAVKTTMLCSVCMHVDDVATAVVVIANALAFVVVSATIVGDDTAKANADVDDARSDGDVFA